MLRLLETEAGVKTAEVTEIQRQRDHECYKQAIEALSQGRTGEGFDRLDELGWIREIPDEDRYRQLAADYVDAVTHGKTAVVVSPTHAEGRRITAEIRRLLQERTEEELKRLADKKGSELERARLGKRGQVLALENAQLTEAERGDAVNYRPGDVLQFHQHAKGYRRGQRVEVGGQPLPLEFADRFGLFHASKIELAVGDVVRITHNGFTLDGKHRLNNGALYRVYDFDARGNIVLDNGWTVAKDFGHLAHGYVVTSHASQGKTVDRVFVGQGSESGPASSREQFYVSCSRGREAVTVYCDDKEALREAVAQSDERLTATELLRADLARQRVRRQQRYEDAIRQVEPYRAPERALQELIHER